MSKKVLYSFHSDHTIYQKEQDFFGLPGGFRIKTWRRIQYILTNSKQFQTIKFENIAIQRFGTPN